jgi:membrane protein required for colicin V production
MVDWAHFNAVDWAILTVLGISIVLSLWRGFVREAVSLAGWIAAFVIANMFGDKLEIVLTPWIENSTGRYIVAFALLFVGTLIMANVLGSFGSKVVQITGLTLLDRLLGTAFGFARGIIIVLVLVYVLRHWVPAKNLGLLEQSQLMTHIDMLEQWAQLMFSRLNSGQNPVISS